MLRQTNLNISIILNSINHHHHRHIKSSEQKKQCLSLNLTLAHQQARQFQEHREDTGHHECKHQEPGHHSLQ
jgi:hypothetical protein